jgi:mannose/fructose/N-acetylgalactosamine-specific phosphotransferase system component IIB
VTVTLVRIDDRLIHGQVVMTWINYTSSNAVYIVDDKVAHDEFMAQVLVSVAPQGIVVKVFDHASAQSSFSEWDASSEKIMILVRSPKTVVQLMDSGADLSVVNLGGLGSAPGKRKLYRNISISKEEEEDLRTLLMQDIEVFIQMLATERRALLTEKMLM